MTRYPLSPNYDSAISFYGKAHVTEKDGRKTLTSYQTDVAYIENGRAYVNGWYSQTTGRHIRDFLRQNGYKAEGKAQIMKDYGVEVSA